MDEHRMKYSVYNPTSGETFEMSFVDEAQKDEWLKGSGWVCLGKLEHYLPTRHERMKNKEEFAGWGS